MIRGRDHDLSVDDAADEHRLCSHLEAVHNDRQIAEQVEQRAQRLCTITAMSPRVMWPSLDSTCQWTVQRPGITTRACPASTFGATAGRGSMACDWLSGSCKVSRDRFA